MGAYLPRQPVTAKVAIDPRATCLRTVRLNYIDSHCCTFATTTGKAVGQPGWALITGV